MARFFGKHRPYADLLPQATSSDGVTGTGAPLNGWNSCVALFSAGSGGGTSDATAVFVVQKNTVTSVASDAASTDWVDISAATQTLGPGVDSDASLGGDEYVDLDIVGLGLSTGLLRIKATAAPTGASNANIVSGFLVFYDKTGTLTDTDLTITQVAAST